MAVDVKMEPIDAELKKLWDEEKGKNRIRASFFNLVIYTEEVSPYYQSLVDSIISKFPCRVLFISKDPHPDTLHTSVTSAAITDEIYCEIIRITVGQEQLEKVPFLVIPQILPDLPLYLLWTADPSSEKIILPSLERYAKRLIVDSRSITNPHVFSQNVLTLMERFHCEVGDLNWAALRSWRVLFRSTFDNYNAYLDLIDTKHVTIEYAKTPDTSCALRPLYFQAWLAAQCEWRFKSVEIKEKKIHLLYERPTHTISISLIPHEHHPLPPGSLLSIDLESRRNKGEYHFKRHEKTRQVFIQHCTEDKCDLPYSTFLTGMSEGQEIIQEIFYTTGGKQYKNMLTLLTHIPWTH